MPPVWRSTGALGATGNDSVALPAPAGITDGDLDLVIGGADSSTLSVNGGGGGWVQEGVWSGPGTEKLVAWWRIWATGMTNPTLDSLPTKPISDPMIGVRLAYQAGTFDAADPIGVVGAAANGDGTAVSHPGIATFAANSLALAIHYVGDNGTTSGQTFGGSAVGVSERADVSTTAGNDAKVAATEKLIAAAGATGAFAATETLTSPWVATILEIREFGAPAMPTGGPGLLPVII